KDRTSSPCMNRRRVRALGLCPMVRRLVGVGNPFLEASTEVNRRDTDVRATSDLWLTRSHRLSQTQKLRSWKPRAVGKAQVDTLRSTLRRSCRSAPETDSCREARFSFLWVSIRARGRCGFLSPSRRMRPSRRSQISHLPSSPDRERLIAILFLQPPPDSSWNCGTRSGRDSAWQKPDLSIHIVPG